MEMAKSVEEYFEKSQWSSELQKLREIILSTGLNETVKWGMPCYTLDKKNVVGMAGFKDHFALWFYQGVFLQDEAGLLVNASEGKTKALRQWRFYKGDVPDKQLIRSYVEEALQNQAKGLEVKPQKKSVPMPDELNKALDENTQLKTAFDKLTPGKRKEYAEFIGSAKKEETRMRRLKKAIPIMLEGKGLNDQYR